MSGIMGAPALQGLACVGRLCCSQGACSSTQTVVRDRALHSPSRCAHSTPRGLVLGCQEGGCVAVRSMVVSPNRHTCTHMGSDVGGAWERGCAVGARPQWIPENTEKLENGVIRRLKTPNEKGHGVPGD